MNLSDDLAGLNYTRYHDWQKNHTIHNSQPAISLFFGDAYKGLDAASLNAETLQTLNNKLIILSGMYGLLRPFDLIQPHRLEMGTKLKNIKGNNLYDFWRYDVTNELNMRINKTNTKYVVNLASNEYFKVVDKKQLKADVITPVFKQEKAGKYKTVAIYAKRARGLMTRFIAENNISNPEYLKAFDYDNYTFSEQMSKTNEMVFIR
jgi:cytoplasmic iron level regulating protein YaaA (DUF328/UPF0246 family)